MTVESVIQAAIPDADESTIAYIMWERTPWPVGKISFKRLYKIASGVRRAGRNKINLCDLCDNRSFPNEYTCEKCEKILAHHRRTKE